MTRLNGNTEWPTGSEPEPPAWHTDLIDVGEAAQAFESLLLVTDGDRNAAAILAVGVLVAEAIRERAS